MTLSPYWVTIEETPERAVLMNSKVVATHSGTRYKFYERKTKKEITFNEGMEAAKEMLVSRAPFSVDVFTRYAGIGKTEGYLHAYVNAMEGDVRVGAIDGVTQEFLRANWPPTLWRPPDRQAMVGAVWFSKEKSLVLMPLPERLPGNERRSIGEQGQWDYPGIYPSLAATDGKSAVGLIGLHGWGEPGGNIELACHWNLEDLRPTTLHPRWASTSRAHMVDGDVVVGTAWRGGGNPNAVLWTMGANEVKVLREYAHAYFSRKDIQAGATLWGSKRRAASWRGTRDSYVDLHALLPAGYRGSDAYWVDKQGTVFGIGEDAKGRRFGIEWKENPIHKILKSL